MELKVLFIDKPTQAEIDSTEHFANSNWGEHSHDGDEGLDFFDKPEMIAHLLVNNSLFSSLVIFFRKLSFHDQMFSFAGIGGVVTHLNHRHQGYATHLLQETLANIKPKCDFAMLCTDIPRLGPVYTGVGFVPLGRPYYFINKIGEKKFDSGGMIAPLSSPEAVTQILNSEDEVFVGTSNF